MKVGDRYLTNKGGWLTVVEYVNANRVRVEFDDEHKHNKYCTKLCIEKGDVKNPFAPRLFGVGFLGVGKHKTKGGTSRLGFKRLPAYSTWANVLSRCYNPDYTNSEVYEDVSVHASWHNFQVFAEWYMNALEKVGWEGVVYLDKDIISNNREYSEHNCCLVPAVINSNVTQLRGNGVSTGVIKYLDHYRVTSSSTEYPIKYQTELDAHLAYVSTKSEKIRTLALEYKESISPCAFEALMTRDFRHKFSPLFPMVD